MSSSVFASKKKNQYIRYIGMGACIFCRNFLTKMCKKWWKTISIIKIDFWCVQCFYFTLIFLQFGTTKKRYLFNGEHNIIDICSYIGTRHSYWYKNKQKKISQQRMQNIANGGIFLVSILKTVLAAKKIENKIRSKKKEK